MIPRAAVVIAILFGAAGLTGYLSRPGESDTSSASPATKARKLHPDGHPKTVSPGAARNTDRPNADRSVEMDRDATATIAVPNAEQRGVRANSSTEPVYYCGALTKKGAPCTRRVKTKGRCWQHSGKPELDTSRD